MIKRVSPFESSGLRLVLAAAGIIALLAIAPIYAVRYLPLHDYPFHVARIVILSQLDNPALAKFYEHGSFLLPNIGMDAVAVPLSVLLGAEAATKLFVALTLLTALFGTLVLHRAAHGRWSAFPLLAVLFLHNGIFRFGFFNYLFGMGLALAAAAWWMVLRPGMARYVIGLICSILLLWCHFEAFAVFAVIAGGVEIGRAWESLPRSGVPRALGNLALASLPFLTCLALFALVSPTAGVASKGFAYAAGMLTKPVGGLFATSSGSLILDSLTVVSLAGLCGWLALTGNLTFSRPLAFAVGAMVLGFFAAPADVMGALYADVRLAPALALLVVASLDIRPNAQPGIQKTVTMLCVGLGLARAAVLLPEWRSYEAQIAPIADAIGKIEPGATLFAATAEAYPSLIADTPAKKAAWSPPMKHVASLAVLGAPVFVPMTWANPTQQPLAVRPQYRPVYDFQGNPKKVPDGAALGRYLSDIEAGRAHWPDLGPVYLLVVGAAALEPLDLPATVSRAAQGERFVLLRLPAN
jgi:hypothetical protein